MIERTGAVRSRTALLLAAIVGIAGMALAGCDVVFPHRSQGERLYRKLCADCHGVDAAGNTPQYMGNPYADLRDNLWKSGGDPVSIERTVREGVFGSMPAHPELTAKEMQAIIDHLRVLRGEKRAEPAS
jgi:mono/diheme cytochrome c family protein